MKTLIITLVSLLLCLNLEAKKDTITVIPGQEIQLDQDTIELGKTTYEALLSILEQRDKYPLITRHWEAIKLDSNGQRNSYEDFEKCVKHKTVEFEFTGRHQDSLILETIKIKLAKRLVVMINDTLYQHQNDLDFKPFSNYTDSIFVKGLSAYSFDNRGIRFFPKEVDDHEVLDEIWIFRKQKTTHNNR